MKYGSVCNKRFGLVFFFCGFLENQSRKKWARISNFFAHQLVHAKIQIHCGKFWIQFKIFVFLNIQFYHVQNLKWPNFHEVFLFCLKKIGSTETDLAQWMFSCRTTLRVGRKKKSWTEKKGDGVSCVGWNAGRWRSQSRVTPRDFRGDLRPFHACCQLDGFSSLLFQDCQNMWRFTCSEQLGIFCIYYIFFDDEKSWNKHEAKL